MSNLSTKKMKQILFAKNLVYQDVADGMGTSISNVSKIFGGFRKNMQFKTLLDLADYFGCTVDDFVVYDKDNESFYLETSEIQLASKIYGNQKLTELVSACECLSDEEIDILNKMIQVFKKT